MKKAKNKIWKHKNLERFKTIEEGIILKLFNDLGLNPIWQYQIGRYICDFVFEEEKVCVEIDGGIHGAFDSDIRDRIKDYTYRLNKYTVIRVKYNNFKKEWDDIERKIADIAYIIREKQY